LQPFKSLVSSVFLALVGNIIFNAQFKISILLHLSGTKPIKFIKKWFKKAKIRDFTKKKSENIKNH